MQVLISSDETEIGNTMNSLFLFGRFGYKTLNETRKVMQRNIDAGIPIVSKTSHRMFPVACKNVYGDFNYFFLLRTHSGMIWII